MRVALFCHSLLSDWNHGNAHFLRGVVLELIARGHRVGVFEPRNAWSVENLVADHGAHALQAARAAFPRIAPVRYDPTQLELDEAIGAADLVLVHEWNDPALVRRIGEHRKRSRARMTLLFHDTHHRAVTKPDEIARYDLSGYDGVLAFGESLRDVYAARGWGRRAWTWHEAADVRTFRPVRCRPGDVAGDAVWIGNWGDGERGAELVEFLLSPARELGLRLTVHGVRYPPEAQRALADAGARCAGWLPNYRVPAVLGAHRFTVHVPRRAYARELAGIPTIRPFEALACGAPLLCAPWEDREGLFTPGVDFLVARDGASMHAHMKALMADDDLRRALSERGRATILARHTCAHRVDQLVGILRELEHEHGAREGAEHAQREAR
jgi:spore maturation protein CgeB